MLYYCLVLLVDLQLCLNTMVLLVEEVNLVLQFQYSLFIEVLLVFHMKMIQVLTPLIESSKSQYFIVSDLDLLIHFLHLLFENVVTLNKFFILDPNLISSLISSS